MDAYRPLGAALFFYECLRLLLLFAFILMIPPGASLNGFFFPYTVFMSPNALFPLIALFVWLRPEKYCNYLSLYMAGKIISVVLFFIWVIINPRQASGIGNNFILIVLIGGSVLIIMMDHLSILGAWKLTKNYRKPTETENGG